MSVPLAPEVLDEPMIFLSQEQVETCRHHPSLSEFASLLPAWVPQRLIAAALGHSEEGMHNAISSSGAYYVWATELENVHSRWRFTEPQLTIDGKIHNCSEVYYHSQKPDPFDSQAWKAQRVVVMRKAIRAKYHASAFVQAVLKATRNHPLLSIKPDAFWGFHPIHGGENMLAKLWEELRAELHQ